MVFLRGLFSLFIELKLHSAAHADIGYVKSVFTANYISGYNAALATSKVSTKVCGRRSVDSLTDQRCLHLFTSVWKSQTDAHVIAIVRMDGFHCAFICQLARLAYSISKKSNLWSLLVHKH